MTSFQEKVYGVVKKIPRGKILTYKQVASIIGSPSAFRAVGNALHKNTNTEIPCHRVIKADGSIGGYRRGARKKAALLKKEGVVIKSSKVVF